MFDNIYLSFHKLFPEKLLLVACILLLLIYGILPPWNKPVALQKIKPSLWVVLDIRGRDHSVTYT